MSWYLIWCQLGPPGGLNDQSAPHSRDSQDPNPHILSDLGLITVCQSTSQGCGEYEVWEPHVNHVLKEECLS